MSDDKKPTKKRQVVTVKIPVALYDRIRKTVPRVRRHGSKALPEVVRPIIDGTGVTIGSLIEAGQVLLERALSTQEKREESSS